MFKKKAIFFGGILSLLFSTSVMEAAKNLRMAVAKAFIQLKNSKKGKKLLKSIKIKNGLEKAENADWDDVRALNIDRLISQNNSLKLTSRHDNTP